MMGNTKPQETPSKKPYPHKDQKQHNNVPTIPQSTRNIIIILGQCSLPTGQPHPWIIDRARTAYQLFVNKNMDIHNTSFIVSGSDVSNRQFCIEGKNKKHLSQAQILYNLLTQMHVAYTNKQEPKPALEQLSIILQSQANTTIQNFYYTFKLIYQSNLQDKIEQIYIITSDFHMRRARFVFQSMFYHYEHKAGQQRRQAIQKLESFDIKNCVHYVESITKWKSQYDKAKKYEKEEYLYNDVFLREQTTKTTKKIWWWIDQNYNKKH